MDVDVGDPLATLVDWMAAAAAAGAREPGAMALATVDGDGLPDVRMVLCKGVDPAAGTVTFFTNLEGAKARQLAANPRAALAFWWPELGAQVRVRGPIRELPRDQVQAYFDTRAVESRVGALVSRQSQPLASRGELLAAYERELEARLAAPGEPFEAPEHWGGFALDAHHVELWANRPARLHDRVRYTRVAGGEAPAWTGERLYP